MSKIGVVIVTFRGGDAVTQALDALAGAIAELDAQPEEPGPTEADPQSVASALGDAQVATEVEVVVVDNASRDGTVQRVRRHAPWARIVELPRNRGFAAGCNVGIGSLQRTDVIVLLNPDVEVRRDFLVRLSALQWPSETAARGPAVLDAQGRIEQSARGFPRARTALLGRSSLLARIRPQSRLLRRDLLADPQTGSRAVDWVSGACLIVPTERFREVGPLDDGYFMYWEDADWCMRAHQLGYRVLYEPTLVVTHRQGASSEGRWIATTIAFHRSAYRYWRMHVAHSPISRLGGALALTIRCGLKLGSQAVRRLGATRESTAASG